jgi:hypothetical protein
MTVHERPEIRQVFLQIEDNSDCSPLEMSAAEVERTSTFHGFGNDTLTGGPTLCAGHNSCTYFGLWQDPGAAPSQCLPGRALGRSMTLLPAGVARVKRSAGCPARARISSPALPWLSWRAGPEGRPAALARLSA